MYRYIVLLLIITVFKENAAFSQSCDEMIKAAQSAEKREAYFDAYKKYDAALSRCGDQMHEEIEQKKQAAVKHLEQQRERADNAEKAQRDALQIARLEKTKADSANRYAQLQRKEAEIQAERSKNLLDSLGVYNNREDALNRFNQYKENGDCFQEQSRWDTAYFCYRAALNIADENPLIRIGKSEIYNLLEKCNVQINNHKNAQKELLVGDSLVMLGGLRNYSYALEIYLKSDQKYIGNTQNYLIGLSSAIEKCIGSGDTLCCSKYENIALRYFLIELTNMLGLSSKSDSLIQDIRKETLWQRNRILYIYEDNLMNIRYSYLIREVIIYKIVLKRRALGMPSNSWISFAYKNNFSYTKKIKYNYNFGIGSEFLISSRQVKDLLTQKSNTSFNNYIYSGINIIKLESTTFGSHAYNKNGNYIELNNVEKRTKRTSKRLSLGYKSGISTLPNKQTRLKSTLSLSVGLKGALAIERYGNYQSVFFSDTSAITSLAFQNSYKRSLALSQKRSYYFALAADIELTWGFGSPKAIRNLSKHPLSRSNPYGIGLRFSSELFQSFTNKTFYKEIYEQYGIIGSNKLTTLDIIFMFDL